MNRLSRRNALSALAGGCTALLRGRVGPAAESRRSRLGIVVYALGIHQRANWSGRHAGLAPALALLEECNRLGAGGIQCPFGPRDLPCLGEIRRRAERLGMHVEAIVDPPGDRADLARFENDLRAARQAGAALARSVIMPGRRYEQFQSLDEFRQFQQRGRRSLELAEPVLARHRFQLAVENHKDERVQERLDTLERLASPWIGLCVDVGNNVALLEDPLETARAFAPFALTVHLKDMAAREDPRGWLLGDMALGEGFLDLQAIVGVLRAAKPKIVFNLETITRDPLPLPVHTEAYWATLPGERAGSLGRMAALVQARPRDAPLASISGLPLPQQLAAERRNVERSLSYARARLGL